jgi:DNA-binding NarL/FixJ family response regulator
MNAESEGNDGRIRLVLVDDHPIVLVGLRARLDMVPHMTVVGVSRSGLEALALVERVCPHVTVVDIGMEGMTGISLTAALVQRQPAVRVLVLSMHDRPAYVRGAFDAGARGYVLKGSDSQDIVNGIEVVAKGGLYYGTGVPVPGEEQAMPRPTPAELKVLRLLANGYRNKEVAEQMGISLKTAEKHRLNLRSKLMLDTVIDMKHYLEAHAWSTWEGEPSPEGSPDGSSTRRRET